MRIGIDIDDTMADTFDYIMPYISEFFGVDLEYLKENNISYCSLPPDMKIRESEFSKTYYDKIIPYTPFKPEVKKYIDNLKELGHQIIVITARDKSLYEDEYAATAKELENNKINYDKLICSFNKAEVCKNEKIDLFVDDSIKNCKAVAQLGIKTLLFNSKNNIKEDTDLVRVNSWKEVYELCTR